VDVLPRFRRLSFVDKVKDNVQSTQGRVREGVGKSDSRPHAVESHRLGPRGWFPKSLKRGFRETILEYQTSRDALWKEQAPLNRPVDPVGL
jgi:hypothetical protein